MSSERESVTGKAGDRGKYATVVSQLDECRIGHSRAREARLRVRLRHVDKLAGAGIGQRPEENGVDHRENCGVCPDAERKSEDRDCGEARRPRQYADRIAQVLPERVGCGLPSGRPDLLAHRFGAARFRARCAERGFAAHPAPHLLLDRGVLKTTQLFLDLCIAPVAANQSADSADHIAQHGYDSPLRLRECG